MSESETSANSNRSRPHWLVRDGIAVYAALGLLAAVVFIPAFFAAFLWDDVIIVGLHEQVSGFADIWLNPSLIESEGHYWPVVYTMFRVEYLLWGVDPVGYHVVNVVIHAANTMLIYALLRRLTVPGCMGRGGNIRRAPGARRLGRLGYRAEGRALGSVLPGIGTGLYPLGRSAAGRPPQGSGDEPRPRTAAASDGVRRSTQLRWHCSRWPC